MNNGKRPVSPGAIEALMEAATVLSESHGDLVADAVREAREHPLDEERARSLYTRIMTILNEHAAGEMNPAERAALADDIRRQVEEIVGSVERPPAEPNIEFVVHNGLHP